MKKSFLKIIVLFLIVGMNWSAISLVSGTDACFNDVELSGNNVLATGILNFELSSENDFLAEVTLGEKATRKIKVENDNSTMNFKYKVRVEENPVGGLCDYLYLDDGTSNEPLNGFVSKSVLFSEKQEWIFEASLDGAGKFWQNQKCKFNLVFEGQQKDCNGFSDVEIIENTVTAGKFGDHLLVSKVYYDVCDKKDGSCGEYKGKEPKHEWIELYNPTSQTVNLKNWQICNSDQCKMINSNNDSVNILPLGYAILAHDASVLKYWDILNVGVETTAIYQLGGNFKMNNDNDMLILKNPDGVVIDQMNWGVPNESWGNDLWNPGIDDVEEGHMLGRVPVGLDTDSSADWSDLELPSVTVTYPSESDIIWHIGKDYEITWEAFDSIIGDNPELTIDIYYSNNSGGTWGVVEKGTENDGHYLWKNIRPVIFTEDKEPYSTLSSHARIKVVATDYTRNFMLRGQGMSDNDFCPPIDCSLFTLEEIKVLVEIGALDESECSVDSDNDNEVDGTGNDDTSSSTILQDNGASDGGTEDGISDENDTNDSIQENEANDGDGDADDSVQKDEDDEKAKPETGDDENDDENDDDTDTGDREEEDSNEDDIDASSSALTHLYPSQEGNRNNGASDENDDDTNDFTQKDEDDEKAKPEVSNNGENEDDSDTDNDTGADADGFIVLQNNGTNSDDGGLNKNMVDSVQDSVYVIVE